MWDDDIDQQHEGLKRKNIESELGLGLDFSVKTTVKSHLVDAGMVEEYLPPGPRIFAIAEWRPYKEAIVNGEVDEAAAEAIEELIAHTQDDERETPAIADGARRTIRSVLTDAFDHAPDSLEVFLRTGDQVEKLNQAVEAIKEDDDASKRDDYDEIGFIHRAYRYWLSKKAVRLYEM